MLYLGGLLVLALIGAFCVCFSALANYEAALLPLPVISGATALLLVAGYLDVLPYGVFAVYGGLLAAAVYCGVRAGAAALCQALRSPGFWLFLAASAFIWLLFAVRQPMFTQWDEFTAWGLAPKIVKQANALYAADPGNLTAYHTYPGTSLVSYLFQGLSPVFSEWQCLAALDILCFACVAAAAALPEQKWPHSILVFAAGVLLPYFFSAQPQGTPSVVYANAMADLPLAFLFGGVLCLYLGAGGRKTGLAAVALPLLLLTLTKDMGFAYALMAVFLIGLDRWLGWEAPAKRGGLARFGAALGSAVALAAVVLAAFLSWGRYTAAVDPAGGAAGVGSAGLSYGQVLAGGARQLLGIGREPAFAQLMAAMWGAFFSRAVCLLGSGAVAVAAITLVAVLAFVAAPQGAARRRVAVLWGGALFCFAALYLFHLILYHYNFAEVESSVLKDYERYLGTYYLGWMLAMLCLLGHMAGRVGLPARLGSGALAACAVGLAAVFCWRGVPASGFWSNTDSLYTLRRDVQQRAAAANTVLTSRDRLLVISQGDDATRWYYYKYELNGKVVDGFGGSYTVPGELDGRTEGDFMNLAESADSSLYDYQAVCTAEALMAYLEETGCTYLLIDRSDGFLQEVFGPLFEGGLDAAMPATLFRFEGAGRTPAFTVAAVAESGVTP